MAIISSYPTITPTSSDLVLVVDTSEDGNPTKTATVGSVNALGVNSTDLITKDVTLTATQMLTLQSGGSLELIAAPGAGKLIAVMNLVYYLDYNSVQYNFAGPLGQTINFYIGTTSSIIMPFNALNAAVDKYGSFDFPNNNSNTLIEPNVAFTLQAAPNVTVSQGNSPFKLSILYREVVLP